MPGQLLTLLLFCVVPLSTAVRTVEINDHFEAQNRTAVPFQCPSFCQECCDASTMLGGARFKCVLKDGISHYDVKCHKEEAKAYKQKMKDIAKNSGYKCSSLERRKATNEQWKIDCEYSVGDQDMEKADPNKWKCSKDMECCCNVEADFVERRCVDPDNDDGSKRKWYKFKDFRAVVHPKLEISKEIAVGLINDASILEAPFTLVNGETYKGNGDRKDTINAKTEIKNGQMRANEDGACQDGALSRQEYYHQIEKGSQPVRGEGCCLATEIDNFVWYDANREMQMEKYARCTLFESLRHCPEGQVYMERVGRRLGMCFGTESTVDSITHSYGTDIMSKPNVFAKGIQSDWAKVIGEATSKVKAEEREDIRGRKEVTQECPTGWASGSFNNGGGSTANHGCECDRMCGRMPAISLAFQTC